VVFDKVAKKALRPAYLQSIGLSKVDSDGEHERNEYIEDLSGDMTQWQVADEHLRSLRQFTHLAAVTSCPDQLNTTTTTRQHTQPFNDTLSGTTQVSRYQKGKTNLDFTEAIDREWQRH